VLGTAVSGCFKKGVRGVTEPVSIVYLSFALYVVAFIFRVCLTFDTGFSSFFWVGIYGCLVSRFNSWKLKYIQRMRKGIDWLWLRIIYIYTNTQEPTIKRRSDAS